MKVKPYVVKIDSPERRSYPDGRWYVDYQVVIGDEVIKNEFARFNRIKKIIEKVRNPRFMNPDGRLGYDFFFLVCSDTYANRPDANIHQKKDIERSLVQKTFDESAAIKSLQARISKIGEIEMSDLSKHLGQILDTTDLDSDTTER